MNTKSTLVLGSILFISVSLFAQDKGAKKPPVAQTSGTAQEDKGQQQWMAYMTPGPMHKMLASANGMWHEDLTFWMTPGAPPQKAEAECSNTMIMGDRYQESFHKGMMMGMQFEGRSVVGFDNAKQMFQSTWCDNMGTGIMYTEGKYDEKTKSIMFKGKSIDPASGKEESVREMMKFVDDNTQMMEMYMTKDGKEFKNMEIKFTRKEKSGTGMEK
jgi:hypothetical protein